MALVDGRASSTTRRGSPGSARHGKVLRAQCPGPQHRAGQGEVGPGDGTARVGMTSLRRARHGLVRQGRDRQDEDNV